VENKIFESEQEFIKFKNRVREIVNDPNFDKPIHFIDHDKKGQIILVTKISRLIYGT
jgi:hypothetical protein